MCLAEELGLEVLSKILQLKDLIPESERYEEESAKEMFQTTMEERKEREKGDRDREHQINMEKMKLEQEQRIEMEKLVTDSGAIS